MIVNIRVWPAVAAGYAIHDIATTGVGILNLAIAVIGGLFLVRIER